MVCNASFFYGEIVGNQNCLPMEEYMQIPHFGNMKKKKIADFFFFFFFFWQNLLFHLKGHYFNYHFLKKKNVRYCVFSVGRQI